MKIKVAVEAEEIRTLMTFLDGRLLLSDVVKFASSTLDRKAEIVAKGEEEQVIDQAVDVEVNLTIDFDKLSEIDA